MTNRDPWGLEAVEPVNNIFFVCPVAEFIDVWITSINVIFAPLSRKFNKLFAKCLEF
jgi:hypothetical protein